MATDAPPIRAAEVVGAVSLATDLGTGQPLEHTLRTAILAVRLGELAGVPAPELIDAYYAALLHSFGCTSDGPEATELYGDDIAPRAAFALVDSGNPEEVGAFLAAWVGAGRPAEVRDAMVAEALANALPLAQATFALHCEVAQRFAGWLGFGSGILEALAFVFERWDGHGLPAGAAGEDIALPARLLHVARDISVFLSATGAGEARAVIERRAGAAYDPRLAALALEHFDDLLLGLDEAQIWDQAIAGEPYYSERAFAHSQALAQIGALASAHHERLDGCGYHRKTLAAGLDRAARIVAAADCYQAMRERRPHRPALDEPGAEAELLREAREGRLCPEAVDAVLAAAGHRVHRRPRELPGGLTNRELEVLLALVAGQSNQEIGATLGISARTAGHHIQHIYEKAGVRSRAAATGWAFQHSLVPN